MPSSTSGTYRALTMSYLRIPRHKSSRLFLIFQHQHSLIVITSLICLNIQSSSGKCS